MLSCREANALLFSIIDNLGFHINKFNTLLKIYIIDGLLSLSKIIHIGRNISTYELRLQETLGTISRSGRLH